MSADPLRKKMHAGYHRRHLLIELGVGAGLGVVALFGYLWLLCPGLYPWESSQLAASVMSTPPGNAVNSHPLWHLAAKCFALLPVGDVPMRLNAFSALCGAGAVSLLFFLSSQYLFNWLNCNFRTATDDYFSPYANAWPPLPAPGRAADAERAKNRHHGYAMAGGAISAVAFAFCLPFWSASTRLHVQTFELLLLLMTCRALALHAFSRTPASLFCAALLFGTGLVESAVFVVFLPVFFVVIYQISHNSSQIYDNFIFLLIAGIGTGLVLAFAVWVVWSGNDVGISGGLLRHIVDGWITGHAEALRAGLPHRGWPLILVYGAIPLCILSFKANNMQSIACVVLNLGFTVLTAVAVLNLPGSPWQLTLHGMHLPILPMLGMSLACGHLFVIWALLSSKPDSREAEDQDSLDRGIRTLALSVAGAMILLVGATPFRNAPTADSRPGAFADRFCREVLDTAPDARYFVTDGTFDSILLARACAQRRNVMLLDTRLGLSPEPRTTPVAAAPQTNVIDFAADWVRRNGAQSRQFALLTQPGIWAQGGLAALPDRVVYAGIHNQEPVELAALMERQRAIWNRMAPLCASGRFHTPHLVRLHQAMRRHLGRIANDLGVFLLQQGAVREASEAFQRARTFDDGNICAVLNAFALHQEHPELAPPGNLSDRMESMLSRPPEYASIAEHEEHFGALHLPYAEHVANAYIFKLKPDVSGKDLNPFMMQVIAFCQSAWQHSSDPVPTPLQCDNSDQDEELSLAVKMILQQQWPMAERLLRALTAKHRKLLPAWALLAEVTMQSGKFNEVRDRILPAMRQVTDAKDAELADLVEGCLALRCPAPDAAVARACFMRVLERKPDLAKAQNLLLQASLLAGDQEILESDCAILLARSRSQPEANAILGGIRSRQNRLPEAKSLLEASILAKPNAPALNDLAETLRRMNDLPAAEIAARRALLLALDYHQAWDTLALVLRDAEKFDEADACAVKARALRLQVRAIRVPDTRDLVGLSQLNPE